MFSFAWSGSLAYRISGKRAQKANANVCKGDGHGHTNSTDNRRAEVPEREAGEPGVDGTLGEAGAHMDGGAGSAVGQLRSTDAAGIGRADRSRHLLCAHALGSASVAARDRVPGAELAGRQPGRNPGARAPAGTAALRILRGSRRGHCGSRGADVRPGRVGAAALGQQRWRC